MFKGIDVSHHQGDIDWQKVKSSGVDFAMIKATEGVGYVDPNFNRNACGATAAGLHIGAYHFLREGDAQEQARECVAAIKMFRWDYPIACDVEHNELLKLGKSDLTNMVIEFCEAIHLAGYYPAVYTNLNWIKNYLDMERFKKYDLWFARYNTVPGYGGVCIWQYSNAGKVPGISSNVDLNISYKDYPQIVGQEKTSVKIDTTMDVSFYHGQYYTVKITAPQSVKITAGTEGVVTIVPQPRIGNDQLFALVAIGQAGQQTGIYTSTSGEKPLKRFVYKIQ